MSDKNEKFKRISDEESSQISGGNVSMIYKKGLWNYVFSPDGRYETKCFFKGNAFDEGKKLSTNSPGSCSGAVREINRDEYEKLLKQKRIQKIM